MLNIIFAQTIDDILSIQVLDNIHIVITHDIQLAEKLEVDSSYKFFVCLYIDEKDIEMNDMNYIYSLLSKYNDIWILSKDVDFVRDIKQVYTYITCGLLCTEKNIRISNAYIPVDFLMIDKKSVNQKLIAQIDTTFSFMLIFCQMIHTKNERDKISSKYDIDGIVSDMPNKVFV